MAKKSKSINIEEQKARCRGTIFVTPEPTKKTAKIMFKNS